MNIRTFKIKIGKVYNGEIECKNPIVELAGKKDVAINCIDPSCGLYTAQLGPNDNEPCLTFLVTCEECDVCGTQVITKCFCDSIDDCKECEICNEDGFCESTCTEICENGTCIECNDEHPCPCNQVCQNGTCTCPPGYTANENGCCDGCTSNSSCGVCEICQDFGGYKDCVAKDCNCDSTGKCGVKGECVECTNSGHCPPNEVCNSHCECDCASGYIRINGVCTPVDCTEDTDCDVCEICASGRCVPNQCPSGKVPVNINGVCSCVQECNCEQPDCSSQFNYCGDSAIPGKCACIPCTGNCEDGCDDPCICDENLNKCKFNPCFGSCEDGTDCGPTCGCLDGQCVPCDSLDCATQECGTALGCGCSNTNKCEKEDCGNAPCSVSSDCAFGCTCDEGICVSCSNFDCPEGCAGKNGCACNGNECEGSEEDCTDSLTLEKDDANCRLIGTLTKTECCQCSPLTLDVISVGAVKVGNDRKVSFKAELRKGQFDGISIYSNPLLGDISNPNIAENERPTVAQVNLSYVVTYDIYDNNTDQYLGTSQSSATPLNASFSGNDYANFADVILPSIGKITVSGNQKQIVKSIRITFVQSNTFKFPNLCEYKESKTIGYFDISNNDQFATLQPLATTIKSSDCRKPFFKWTKSTDATFNESPFRKKYIDPKSVNVYEDIITHTEGGESCFHYLFESDCTCDEPESKYVVFCNPDDFTAVITNCGKRATVDIDPTCSANYDKDFGLYLNGSSTPIDTFKLQSAYHNVFNSILPITSIKLRLLCDTTDECAVEKFFPDGTIDPIPQAVCEGDGSVTFTFDSSSYPVSISNIVFDGITSLGSGNPKIFTFSGKEIGVEYTYRVTFTNGCISDEKTVIKDNCCQAPTIECLSTGNYKVISANGYDGILYDGQIIPTSGTIVPPSSGTKPLTYSCNDETQTILISPYSENSECCRIIPYISVDGTTITIGLNSNSTPGTYTITVGTKTGTVSPGGSAVISNVEEGSQVLTITNNTNDACFYSEGINVSTCDLGLQLLMDDLNCNLRAETDERDCFCPSGSMSASITNVVSVPNNKLAVSYNFTPNIQDSTGVDVVSSTLKLYSGDDLIETESLTNLSTFSGVFNANKNCVVSTSLVAFTINVTPCGLGCLSGYTHYAVINCPVGYALVGISAPGTYSSIGSSSGNEYYFYFNPVTTSISFILTIENVNTNELYTKNIVIPNVDSGEYHNFTIEVENSSCANCATVVFEYSVSLEDGCSYEGQFSKYICAGQTANIAPISLTKIDSIRKMEFLLFENSVQIRRDFAEDPYAVDYNSSNGFLAIPGATYASKAICGCDEEVQTTECFDTVITPIEPSNGYNCAKRYAFEVTSCYIGANASITIGSTTVSFTINGDGFNEVVVNLPNAVTASSVSGIFRYSGNVCQQSISFENPVQFVPTVEYLCTDITPPTLEYNATILATLNGVSQPVTIVSIPSGVGYGTVSGNALNGVTVTTPFQVTIELNGDNDCRFNVTLQSQCDCNITSASVTPFSQSVCVVNGVVQGSPSLSLSPTRTNNALAWYAVAVVPGGGNVTLVNGSTSNTVVVPVTTSLMPNSGINNISIYFRDSLAGDDCRTQNISITRNNLTYSAIANSCSSGFWSVTVSGTGLTLSGQSSGTISGNNVVSIPSSTASVTFTVSGNGCSSSTTVNRPAGCVSCNNSNVNGSYLVTDEPCDTTSHNGIIRISASSSNSGCGDIASVTFDGINANLGVGGYWYAFIPSSYSGTYDVIITDECGCFRTLSAVVNQNCCGSAPTITASTTTVDAFLRAAICSNDLPESITFTVTGLPVGHNLELIGIETSPSGTSASGTWTTAFTNTGGTFNVTSLSGSPTTLNLQVRLWQGPVNTGTNCSGSGYISGGYVSIITCSSDPCSGFDCPSPCQHCVNVDGMPDCQGNASLNGIQSGCASGEVCCNGGCVDSITFQTDEDNCGVCGNNCSVGYSCCSGACVDTDVSSTNCGACGVTCDPGEVCCSGVCQVPCSPGPDIPYPNGCDYIHESCSPCSSVVTSYLNCLTAPSVINMNSWTCELGDCVVRGSITITKNAACSFIAPADNYVYPYGGSVNCSSVVGQIDVLTVESTSVVGNNLTINFIASKNSAAPVDICGNSYPVAVFISVNGGSYNCCNLTTVSFSACPVCTTC